MNLTYQLPVHPTSVRYFTKEMIDELKMTHRIQDKSFSQTAFTIVQLGYTVYECIEGSGQKWSKVVMIIFMIMSILQTISVYVLPTQVAAYSIKAVAKYPKDIEYFEDRDLFDLDPVTRFLLCFFPNVGRRIFTDRECVVYDTMYKTGKSPEQPCGSSLDFGQGIWLEQLPSGLCWPGLARAFHLFYSEFFALIQFLFMVGNYTLS
ncbi:hypothetical protein CLU79DRAFT_723890 [Phycomyces nitens]|nr:hypothetical protein CLU79DRAFT_723890 [Phycomyces nitens]